MQLPLKVIVAVAILVTVLIAVSLLLLQSSGASLTRADAEKIFNAQCLAYSQRDCDWTVTYEPAFNRYLEACRVLHGSYREAYSCLYSLCTNCFESRDLRCSGLCKICSGHDYASVEKETCCLRYKTECTGSTVDCSKACA